MLVSTLTWLKAARGLPLIGHCPGDRRVFHAIIFFIFFLLLSLQSFAAAVSETCVDPIFNGGALAVLVRYAPQLRQSVGRMS